MFGGNRVPGLRALPDEIPGSVRLGSNHLDIYLEAVNTGVLILSSFTMAMAVYFTQVENVGRKYFV